MDTLKIDASKYQNDWSFRNKVARSLWGIVWAVPFRCSPRQFHGWRRWLLRRFGADVASTSVIHPSCRIWAPWNLRIGEHSCLGPFVDCYCVDSVEIGNHVTVSQYSYLCGASHDYQTIEMRLLTGPITIDDGAWIAADAFVGPNVVIHKNAVVGARSSVFKDVGPYDVVVGSPAKFLKKRHVSDDSDPNRTHAR